MPAKRIKAALLLFCAFVTASTAVRAAEDAKGFVLLGSNASMSGAVPPPGTYFTTYEYFYTGDASATAAAGIVIDQIGAQANVQANVEVDADIFISIPTFLWVAPGQVLGGNAGFGVLIPFGSQDISADVDALATLNLPDGRTFGRGAHFRLDDDTFAFGDPVLTAFLGWHRGNWHWKVAGLLNVPVGSYDKDNLANMGFNRWGFDASAAVTWLDPAIGLEVSTAAGFTFNGRNPDTDYRTGTEFHVEAAIMQHFSKTFAVGLTGYHYDQITGDSGGGAALGDFKGRVSAIGPNINYTFLAGQIPVSTSLRWLHEFEAKNRLEGEAFLFTAAMPLSIPRR